MKSSTTLTIKSVRAMRVFASGIAKDIVASPKKKTATVIGLVGNLGAGKTAFTGGFLRALGVKGSVLSPTFVLMRNYALRSTHYKVAYHIDAYRLDHPKELLAIGFKELIKNPNAIVLVEWANQVKKIMPAGTKWIEIKHGQGKTERVVVH